MDAAAYPCARSLPVKLLAIGIACAASALVCSGRAYALGDEGHEVIGLIADHYLTASARARVRALLAGDDTGLVPQDIAHEAAWADKYRDSDRDADRVR